VKKDRRFPKSGNGTLPKTVAECRIAGQIVMILKVKLLLLFLFSTFNLFCRSDKMFLISFFGMKGKIKIQLFVLGLHEAGVTHTLMYNVYTSLVT